MQILILSCSLVLVIKCNLGLFFINLKIKIIKIKKKKKNYKNFYKFNQVFDEFGPLVNSNFGQFARLNFDPKKRHT